MNHKAESWSQAVPRLVVRFATGWYMDRVLANPWSRAANCMVQGWCIRLSRPPAKGNACVTSRPTWRVFARLAARIAATKARHAGRSDWHLWATRRISAGKGITDEQFGRAMGGDAIEAATAALLDDLVDFFPSQRRKLLGRALAKFAEFEAKAMKHANAKLDALDDAAMNRLLNTGGEPSGNSPASSASPPAP